MIDTLGDSILDNRFWVPPKNSVEEVLADRVRDRGISVVSHAYDGFTTRSLLEGDTIGAVLPPGPQKDAYMSAKALAGRTVHPLNKLRQTIEEVPQLPHYVVICVGGNDFRTNLGKPCRFIQDIPKIQERYLQIVQQVNELKDRNVRPILVFQYRTDANRDPYCIYPILTGISIVATAVHVVSLILLSAPLWALAGKISILASGLSVVAGGAGLYLSQKVLPFSMTKEICTGKNIGMVTFGLLIQSFYRPILEYAKKERIPILDLPNTFNPYENLYKCGIEPNQNGSQLIAEGIDHIITYHHFDQESLLYAKEPGHPNYTNWPNTKPENWRVKYPPST